MCSQLSSSSLKMSPHHAELVTQRLIASVERLPALPQSGRVVPEIDDPTVREVIQGSLSNRIPTHS